MYRLACIDTLWEYCLAHPDVFKANFMKNSLKPLGHALAAKHVDTMLATETLTSLKVLELGHGAYSPFLQLYCENPRVEYSGIDTYEPSYDKYHPPEALDKLRQQYPSSTFYDGLLGRSSQFLRPDTYDLVFSVSVIEHVPLDELNSLHSEIYRVLKPGGIQLHSYDCAINSDILTMFKTIANCGFTWKDEKLIRNLDSFWHLSPSDLAAIVLEHPYNVMEHFQFKKDPEERKLINWTTVEIQATKPARPQKQLSSGN